ncbi:hypothetical protein D3C72_275510 [compost metagenome]
MTHSTTATLDAPVKDFLSALIDATQDPIRLFVGDTTVEVTDDLDVALAQAGAAPIYLSPVTTTAAVPFLYSFTENAQPDQWQDDVIQPTAVLFKDGGLICAYALETAVAQDAALDTLAERMNGHLDDAVPAPGANGWELVHLDASTFYPLATLAEAWADAAAPAVVTTTAPWEGEDHGLLNDARLLTPFALDDPRYVQDMIVSIGANHESKVWTPKTMTVAAFVDLLSAHREDKHKDGLAFVLAEIVGNQRKKVAVTRCYGVGLDIDVGVAGAVIDEALVKLGCLAVRYTTHSHGKTSTKLLKGRIAKWCKKHDLAEGVTQDTIIRFLREESRWDESIISTVEYAGDVHDPEGFMVQVDHIPMPKHRVVLPLTEPFVPTTVAKTHDEGMKMWGDVCRALAKALGDLALDRSAVDPSRLFYFPRHVAARPFETRIVGGDLLDWKTLDLSGADAEPGSFEALLAAEIKTTEKTKSKSTTDKGRDLGHWSKSHADRFQIVDLIKDHAEDRVRTNGAHKIDIECPFDEEHSDPGNPEDKGCFAVNAGDGDAPIFTVKCQHDSCSQRTNLDHLGKMLADGWFDQSTLNDADYYSLAEGGEPVVVVGASAAPPTAEDVRATIKALPPKKEGPDVKPVLDMIARLDDKDDRETLIGLLKTHSGRSVVDLRKSVDDRRKVKAKPAGPSDHVRVDAHSGFATFTYRGEPDHRKARTFLVDQMNQVNKAARLPLFSLNRGQPTALRRYEGVVSFEALDQKTFQADLFEFCSFAEHVEEGELIHKVPDSDITGIVHAGLRPGELPSQPSIRRAPTIGKDGSVMDRDGWFGDVLVDLGDLTPPVVPLEPTEAEIAKARELLLDDVLGDFPMDDEDADGARGRSKASLANAVAMLITQFCRDQFKGPSPLFAVVKPSPGVGGTLMAELPQRLFDGFPSTTTPNSRNEDEMEKLMSSAAMGNESFMFFDNVRDFNSDTVKRTCTSDRIGGRKLGSSQMVSRPNDMLWQITGINPRLGAEMTRRSVFINLNSRLESNAKRNYRHEDFKGWLGENRSQVIGAILTLIRAWYVAGAMPSTDKLASFESWAGVIGGILKNAEIDGFLTNPRNEAEDREGAETKEFIVDWLNTFKDADTTEKKAFDYFDGESSIVFGYGEERRRNFGRTLDSLKGRAFEMGERLMMFSPGAVEGWRLVEIKAVAS